MPVDISKFRDLFVSEAEEHTQKLNDNLLLLEKDAANKELLNELMRSSHTIKGSAATMQYTKLAFLTHVMEDVFDYAKNGVLSITPEIMETLYETVDELERSLASIKKDSIELPVDDQASKLKKITGVVTEGVGRSMRSEDGKPMVSPVAVTAPAKSDSKEIPSDKKKDENRVDDKKESATASSSPEVVLVPEKLSHIKVPIERLDGLMNLAEELVIGKMRLEQEKKASPAIENTVNHVSRLISDLQYQVMQVRLVPVEQVTARFPRMVRDLAVAQKKKVSFEMEGGELELDRTVVDKLGEPLLHLLRNAVDHGIYTEGKILLSARRDREFALISVENDGKNIDWQRIIEVASQKGMITPSEARVFSERAVASGNKTPPPEVCDVLFKGFSTRTQVSETSGRGVGMTIVKKFVSSIGGRIIVESPLITGAGTRFTLELPLSLAIINALLVEVSGQVMAVPFGNVERSVMIPSADIKRLGDREVAVLGERDIPLSRLRMIEPRGSQKEEKDFELVVIMKRGEDNIGFVVDRLVEEQEIIVKPLAPILRRIKGFSGSTILGDGRTVLVVDVVGLLENQSLLQL